MVPFLCIILYTTTMKAFLPPEIAEWPNQSAYHIAWTHFKAAVPFATWVTPQGHSLISSLLNLTSFTWTLQDPVSLMERLLFLFKVLVSTAISVEWLSPSQCTHSVLSSFSEYSSICGFSYILMKGNSHYSQSEGTFMKSSRYISYLHQHRCQAPRVGGCVSLYANKSYCFPWWSYSILSKSHSLFSATLNLIYCHFNHHLFLFYYPLIKITEMLASKLQW